MTTAIILATVVGAAIVGAVWAEFLDLAKQKREREAVRREYGGNRWWKE